MKKARILFYDLETSPNLGYTWGKYEQNVIKFEKEWEILSVAWKWQGEKKTHVLTRADFKDKTDKSLVLKLWDLLDEADVVVGQNSNKFDNKKSNTRFVYYQLPPPTPFFSIDTLTTARRVFSHTSNSLNDMCNYLGIGTKVHTGGVDLWFKCMAGDKKAFKVMAKYNKQDVVLLEKLYERYRPWMANHPNIGILNGKPAACPRCQIGTLHSKGFKYTKTQSYRTFRCSNCRGLSRSRTGEKIQKPEFIPV